MANLTQHLISISPDLRSGSSPGRRLLALALCSMLVLASIFPGVALAGEVDSEGEGSAPSIELPAPPDFDPGGEEAAMEEAPATGGEETGAVEIEAEVEVEAPPPEEVTSAPAEAPSESVPPQPAPAPAPAPASSAPAPVEQQASEPATSEPVANQSIVAPKQGRVERSTASEGMATSEAPPPAGPAEREAPMPSPQPVSSTPPDPARSLAGKDIYVVRPGDCLWHIAASLLSGDADNQAIAGEVARLWRLNENRIGTEDPNLLFVGTTLKLR